MNKDIIKQTNMKYIIGNWKSNQTLTESLIWLDDLKALKPKFNPGVKVVICLPFTEISAFNEKLTELNLPITTGAQNVSHLPSGKHTGEITANMLGELVNYCIVGHSERRKDFKETSEVVALKAKALLENSVTPIVCLDLPYLDQQIRELFEHDVDVTRCFFVYEPIAAIGTGKPVEPVSANHVANQVAFLLDNKAPVLYGGSVTADNVFDFTSQSRIDGVLVGTDSLEPTLFSNIINRLS